MIASRDAGDALSDDELIATAVLLFSAGFETTTNLIGNGMGALLRNPGEMDRLWADASLLPSAVEDPHSASIVDVVLGHIGGSWMGPVLGGIEEEASVAGDVPPHWGRGR